MKHNMNRVLSIVALLMLTLGTWAANTVDDVNVNVKPNADAGTVTYDISEGKCTLTVTPATGYYLTEDNLTAVATVKGEVIQAPRRNLPIDNGELTITPDENNTNPAGVTKYTFTIPEGCNVEVTAEFRKVYSIPEVNGVSFDAETNTLTLTNATINAGDGWAFEFGPSVTAVDVVLEGENTINGNGFLFAESPVALTFKTDVAEPGSLTVSGENSAFAATTVNQGTVNVYCENGLVYDATAKKVSAPALTLTVGGVEVSNLNASRIVGSNISGIVSFDAEKNILTLNGATIDMTQGDAYPIVSTIKDLTVHLIGVNTLKTNASAKKGFKYNGGLESAKLTFTREDVCGDNGFGTLKIVGGDDIAEGYNDGNTFETANTTGWVKTTDAEGTTVSYVEYYGLSIGGIQINSSYKKITSENGTATYEPTSQTLYLRNYTTTGNINSTLNSLTVSLTGLNSVGAMTGNNAGGIIVRKNITSGEDYNKLSATSLTGFTALTIEEPLKNLSGESGIVISDMVTYNLWIEGRQVTKENMNAIIEGVSFDGDHTLTLNKVNSDGGGNFITNGLSQLTIHLLGENTVNCQERTFMEKLIDEHYNDYSQKVTFTTDPNAAGNLTMAISNGSQWYLGCDIPEFKNNLTCNVQDDGFKILIAAPSVDYNLMIGSTKVTNLNASNITDSYLNKGIISFDVTTNTLTLNGVNLSTNIDVNREALNILLIGENKIGSFNRSIGIDCDMVFVPNSDKVGDKLTMRYDVPGIFKVEYRSMMRKVKDGDDYVIALPNDYGLKVNSTLITPTNRLNVLDDDGETVQFDGNGKLILNNASLTSSIELGDIAYLPEVNGKKTLTIHLDGSAVMTEGTGKILKFTGTSTNKSDYQVVLDINSNIPGEFVYKFTGKLASIPKSLEEAFDGISVSTNEKLDAKLDVITRTLTVSASLTPIIQPAVSVTMSEKKQEASRDFASSKVSTLTLTNVVVDNILYTLNDTHTKNAEDDGYESGKVVLNSKVSKTALALAMRLQPGSPEFASIFKGLTFEVPAGSGIIALKDVSGQPGEVLCVKIGWGDPIEIHLSATPTDHEVEYCCAAATFIYVYLPESSTSAPAMVNRRIGPKSSVAGGLGGISVQSHSMQTGESVAQTFKTMEKSAMAAALSSVTNARNGYKCSDPKITNLPDNMFVKKNTTNAPSRRDGEIVVETILPEGLTFLDFSNTKITGMEVSRSNGAFNGVPDNVFIYMPAGNTTKDKNVVIGGICDNLELDGSENAQPFKALKDFKVGQAVLKREFEGGMENSRATIYLPYSISKTDANLLGKFYEYKSNDGTTVQMTEVTDGLKANKPYIYQPNFMGVKDPLVRTVDVVANPAETEGFKGVYERKDYEDGMYCYAAEARDGKNAVGEFVEMGSGSWVPPFRAYMIGNGAPSYAIAWDGKVDNVQNEQNQTAVETVKTVADKKVAEGWWTINGLRLNAQPKKAGLYVKDGKMVVVK